MDLPYIPYFQTTRYRVETMMELAQIKPGELAADLGSGDGRILIELAKRGAIAYGYELDERLIKQTQENIKRVFPSCHPELGSGSLYLETKQTSITVFQKDFWQENLGMYDIICVYPMPDIMENLEEKLQKELKKGSRVLLNYYPFPNWQPAAQKDHIYLYIR